MSLNISMKPSILLAKRAPTIRSRLIGLVLACVIPAFAMAVALIFNDYQRDRAHLSDATMETARAMTSAVDKELTGVQATLLVLARSQYLANDDFGAFSEQAKEVIETQKSIVNIVVLDRKYHQRMNTLVPVGGKLPVGPESVAAPVFRTSEPVTTDIFIGPVTQKYTLAASVPVYRNGEIAYVLAAGMWPERLSTLLTRQHLPDSWIGTILDSSGNIVARTHQIDRFLGRKGAPALVARMAAAREGILETVTLEGIPVISVFSRSTLSNWTVAIGIPTASLTADLAHRLWSIVAGTALLLLASGLLAWRIGARIATSISRLVEPALALGYGQRTAVPPLPLREADEVGKAITKASDLLLAAQTRANHDPLTGLANRAFFQETLARQIEICNRNKSYLALLYIDLDGFKIVNDVHGHPIGDEVLCVVASRLTNSIRAADLAVRLGGDEFALLLIETRCAGAQTVAQKVIDALSARYAIGTLSINISASIGIAIFPGNASSAETLVECADAAMYEAKKAGKRRYVAAAAA
jgi:diguanylate cyclase (GGDEF)-like protein